MVFDVLGPSLLWFVRALQHRGLPREDVRCITRDVLQGLVLLHQRCSMVHTDLKLENILLSHGVSPLDVPADPDDALLQGGALLRGWAAGSGEHAAQRTTTPALWLQIASSMQGDAASSSDSDEGVVSEAAPPLRPPPAAVALLPDEGASAQQEQTAVLSLPVQLTLGAVAGLRALDPSLSSLPALPLSPGSPSSAAGGDSGSDSDTPALPSSEMPAQLHFGWCAGHGGHDDSAIIATLRRVEGPHHTIALRRTGPAPAPEAAAAAAAGAAGGAGSQQAPSSQLHDVYPYVLHVYTMQAVLPVLSAVEASCSHFLWVVHSTQDASGTLVPSLRGLACRKAALLRIAADVLPHMPSAPLLGRGVKLPGGETMHAAACVEDGSLLPRPLKHRCWLAGVPVDEGSESVAAAAAAAAAAAFGQAAAAVQGFCSLWPAQHRLTCAIVDLGNACDVANPFSDDIQTRQYRAPEVLVRAGFDTSADMWSMGCIVFELLTGDFLFNPRGGANFTCDEDHLAQMVELMGDMPKSLRRKGADAKLFFTPAGKLKNIKKLKYWPVKLVLQDKYGFDSDEAACVADFLESLLALQPEHRCSAQAALQHPWLQPHLSHAEAVSAFSGSVVGGAGGAAGAPATALPDTAAATTEAVCAAAPPTAPPSK